MSDQNLCIKASDIILADRGNSHLKIKKMTIGCGTFSVVIGLTEEISTLFIRLLAGTYKPLQGEIELWQQPVAQINRRILTSRVSIISRHERPGFSFPVGDFVRQGRENSLQAFQTSTAADSNMADQIMQRLGIAGISWRDSNLLGRSDLLKTMLARSLVQNPYLLLIDNFLQDINQDSRICILNTLYEECKNNNKTIVVTSEDPAPLVKYADQLIIFTDNNLQEQISFAEPEAESKLKKYLPQWGYASLADMLDRSNDAAACARSADDPLF